MRMAERKVIEKEGGQKLRNMGEEIRKMWKKKKI